MEVLLQRRHLSAQLLQAHKWDFAYMGVFKGHCIAFLGTRIDRPHPYYIAGHMESRNVLFSSESLLKCHEITSMNDIEAVKLISCTEKQIIPIYPATCPNQFINFIRITFI